MLKTVGTLLCTSVLFAGISFGETLDVPEITIGNIVANGSGCKAQDFDYSIVKSGDSQAVSLFFSEFLVETFLGDRPARKNCNISMELNVPSGWTAANTGVDYLGYYSVNGNGSYVNQNTTYFFQGNLDTNNLRYSTTVQQFGNTCYKYEGRSWVPTACMGEFTASDTFNMSSWVWSPCGAKRNLIINMNVQSRPGRVNGAEALMYLDLADIEVDTKFNWDPRKQQNAFAFSHFKLQHCRPTL